jgi:hypothetical protein
VITVHIPKSVHDDLWKPSDYTWSIEVRMLIMTSFPVLVADHSQAKYFGKYLSLTDTDVLSYSGFRIDQMFQKLQP